MGVWSCKKMKDIGENQKNIYCTDTEHCGLCTASTHPQLYNVIAPGHTTARSHVAALK